MEKAAFRPPFFFQHTLAELRCFLRVFGKLFGSASAHNRTNRTKIDEETCRGRRSQSRSGRRHGRADQRIAAFDSGERLPFPQEPWSGQRKRGSRPGHGPAGRPARGGDPQPQRPHRGDELPAPADAGTDPQGAGRQRISLPGSGKQQGQGRRQERRARQACQWRNARPADRLEPGTGG